MECISVIVPIYNSERYLEACLESILSQNVLLELVLVDDGSTDGSANICKEYQTEYPNVCYVHQDNSGVSAARNNGVKRAKYENIMFVDSDDMLMPGTLKLLMEDAEKYDFLMCGYSERTEITGETRSYQCKPFDGEITSFVSVVEDYIFPPLLMGPCFKVFKKNIIISNHIEFPLDLSYGEDALFVLSYLNYVRHIKCYDYMGYIYRKFGGGTLSSTYRSDRFGIELRINSKIRNLIRAKSEDSGDLIYNKRTLLCAVIFTKEMMMQNISYTNRKKCFFNTLEKSELKHTSRVGKSSFAEKLILLTMQHKVPFFVLYIFRIREKLRKKR